MAMKSLKITKSEAKKDAALCQPIAGLESQDRYPYELRITLDDDTLKKLDIKSVPTAGTKIVFEARATVIGSSERETQGDVRKSVDLQITDMDFETPEQESEEDRITREDSGPASRLAKRMRAL